MAPSNRLFLPTTVFGTTAQGCWLGVRLEATCQLELESWATSSPRETRRWSSKQREDPAPENSSSWPAALNDALSALVMSTVVPGAGHALQLYSDTKRLQPPRVGRQPEPPHLTSRQKGLTRSARASSCSAFLPSTEGHTICLTIKLTLGSETHIPYMPARTTDGSVNRFSRKRRRCHQRLWEASVRAVMRKPIEV